MSKKQRERVEDEANFHKQRQRLGEITPTTTSGGPTIYRHEDMSRPMTNSPTNNNVSSDHLNGYLL